MDDEYFEKYIKYKNKYLLKKKLYLKNIIKGGELPEKINCEDQICYYNEDTKLKSCNYGKKNIAKKLLIKNKDNYKFYEIKNNEGIPINDNEMIMDDKIPLCGSNDVYNILCACSSLFDDGSFDVDENIMLGHIKHLFKFKNIMYDVIKLYFVVKKFFTSEDDKLNHNKQMEKLRKKIVDKKKKFFDDSSSIVVSNNENNYFYDNYIVEFLKNNSKIKFTGIMLMQCNNLVETFISSEKYNFTDLYCLKNIKKYFDNINIFYNSLNDSGIILIYYYKEPFQNTSVLIDVENYHSRYTIVYTPITFFLFIEIFNKLFEKVENGTYYFDYTLLTHKEIKKGSTDFIYYKKKNGPNVINICNEEFNKIIDKYKNITEDDYDSSFSNFKNKYDDLNLTYENFKNDYNFLDSLVPI